MPETLRLVIENGVGCVTLARPQKLNAVSPAMVRELRGVVDAVRADPEVRALVFTGEGRAFSAGADISELVRMESPTAFLHFLEDMQGLYDEIERLRLPTLAAVNGIAYGGGLELALACDLRVAADDAKLGVPEILIGVLPGAGGTQRLSRMLPAAIAKQMLFFGEPLDAETALRHGLVNATLPREKVLETALGLARRLAELPPLALAAAKDLVHAAGSGDLRTGIDAERQTVAFLFGTEDGHEGMKAFLEKRRPTFRGR